MAMPLGGACVCCSLARERLPSDSCQDHNFRPHQFGRSNDRMMAFLPYQGGSLRMIATDRRREFLGRHNQRIGPNSGCCIYSSSAPKKRTKVSLSSRGRRSIFPSYGCFLNGGIRKTLYCRYAHCLQTWPFPFRSRRQKSISRRLVFLLRKMPWRLGVRISDLQQSSPPASPAYKEATSYQIKA